MIRMAVGHPRVLLVSFQWWSLRCYEVKIYYFENNRLIENSFIQREYQFFNWILSETFDSRTCSILDDWTPQTLLSYIQPLVARVSIKILIIILLFIILYFSMFSPSFFLPIGWISISWPPPSDHQLPPRPQCRRFLLHDRGHLRPHWIEGQICQEHTFLWNWNPFP